jgi:hypothetical protein
MAAISAPPIEEANRIVAIQANAVRATMPASGSARPNGPVQPAPGELLSVRILELGELRVTAPSGR